MNEKNNDSVKIEEPEMEKKENEEECSSKKRTKEDRAKKKDDKRPADQYSKILSHVSSTEEKLDMMCKKYTQTVDENRKLSLALKHSEKKVELLLRERDQLQIERSKSIMTRKRLENLCRELQRQNKLVKNESLQRVKEQEEIRKDLSEKFQGGLAQITTLMNQNIEKNAKMYEENLEINKKFKAVYEQVEQKEQQLLKVHQQMKLDLQIADAKLAKVKMEATAEKEILLKEKQQLLLKMTEYQAQIKELQATEVGLRSEISMYTDKYDEFQNALNRSNKIYGEFNVEMEKMTKKIYVLEKETTLWKQRWVNSNDALLAMATDKQARDAEIATLNKKLALLQDLCKMFQCERAKLLAQLKTQNNKTLSQESSTVPAESQEVIKYTKQTDELPNLENTFEQLQVSPVNVPEAMQKIFDASPKTTTTKTANDTAIANQKPEAAKVELDKENAELLQTVLEFATGDSSKNCNPSKSKEETTKSSFHIDSITLNDMIDAQKVKNDSQESSSTSLSTITEITDEESEKSTGLSKVKEVNEDSHKLTEPLQTEEKSEEANEVAESPKDVSDKSVIVEKQIETNVEETDDEIEAKKQKEVSEQNNELSKLELEALSIVEKDIILQALDLIEKKEIDLLRNNTDNHVNDKLESQTIENKDDTSRTYENATNETVQENESTDAAYTNSNVIHNETLSEDLTQNNSAASIERNNIAEINNKCEPESIESINTPIKNTSEVFDAIDMTAIKEATLLIENKSEDATETANEVAKNSSELVDDTTNIHLTNDVLSSNESTSKLTADATCISVNKNATSPKEIPAKRLSTSESDCTEEKLRKPAPIKNGKRRKK